MLFKENLFLLLECSSHMNEIQPSGELGSNRVYSGDFKESKEGSRAILRAVGTVANARIGVH